MTFLGWDFAKSNLIKLEFYYNLLFWPKFSEKNRSKKKYFPKKKLITALIYSSGHDLFLMLIVPSNYFHAVISSLTINERSMSPCANANLVEFMYRVMQS